MAESIEIHAPCRYKESDEAGVREGDLKNWCLLPHMCPAREYQHEGALAGSIISQILWHKVRDNG